MLDGLQLDGDVLDDAGNVMAYGEADQDFYDNLKQVVGEQHSDGIEPEIAMGDVDMDMMAAGIGPDGLMRIDDGVDGSDDFDFGAMDDLDRRRMK